jgi:hypothetical protein
MRRIILFCIIINLSACHYTAPEFRKIENINVNQISPNKIIVNATARFHNPNKSRIIKISSIQLDAIANNRTIGSVSNKNIQKPIYKDSDILLPFDLEVNPTNLLSNLNNIIDIMSGKSFILDLNGFVETKMFLFKKRAKVEHQESINLNNIIKK